MWLMLNKGLKGDSMGLKGKQQNEWMDMSGSLEGLYRSFGATR
jgi:hypothetical protein